MVSMVSDPSTVQGPLPPIKPTPSIIQAAPTVYCAPPAPIGLKRVDIRAHRQSRMVCVFWLVCHRSCSVVVCLFQVGSAGDGGTGRYSKACCDPRCRHGVYRLGGVYRLHFILFMIRCVSPVDISGRTGSTHPRTACCSTHQEGNGGQHRCHETQQAWTWAPPPWGKSTFPFPHVSASIFNVFSWNSTMWIISLPQ